MRREGIRTAKFDSGPNMTPLVDVVMVILIFLMLAGSFGINNHYLTSNLPISDAGVAQSDTDVIPDERFTVQILSNTNGGFSVVADNVNLTNLSLDPQSGSRELLVQAFARHKSRMSGAARTPADKIQVILAPGASTLFEHIAVVYEAALKAEFKKVAFRAA